MLVGEEGDRDCVLSSPIIFTTIRRSRPRAPVICSTEPRSTKYLTLRIMSLTDDEKREMRNADELARKLLERTESMSPDQLMNLHGVMKKV